ncbi:hypothetical protein ACLKA6_011995 [Drosophila palustris]
MPQEMLNSINDDGADDDDDDVDAVADVSVAIANGHFTAFPFPYCPLEWLNYGTFVRFRLTQNNALISANSTSSIGEVCN